MTATANTENIEDSLALAIEGEEILSVLEAEAHNASFNAGWHDGYGSRPHLRYQMHGKGTSYDEGYDDGKKEWLRDCA